MRASSRERGMPRRSDAQMRWSGASMMRCCVGGHGEGARGAHETGGLTVDETRGLTVDAMRVCVWPRVSQVDSGHTFSYCFTGRNGGPVEGGGSRRSAPFMARSSGEMLPALRR